MIIIQETARSVVFVSFFILQYIEVYPIAYDASEYPNRDDSIAIVYARSDSAYHKYRHRKL